MAARARRSAVRIVRSKYGAVATLVDGIRFDSKAEARRYSELKLLQQVGEIRGLELQPKVALLAPVMASGGVCEGVRSVGHYRADFGYYEKDERVLEDVKGVRTAIYKLKKRIVEATYGIQIREIR